MSNFYLFLTILSSIRSRYNNEIPSDCLFCSHCAASSLSFLDESNLYPTPELNGSMFAIVKFTTVSKPIFNRVLLVLISPSSVDVLALPSANLHVMGNCEVLFIVCQGSTVSQLSLTACKILPVISIKWIFTNIIVNSSTTMSLFAT